MVDAKSNTLKSTQYAISAENKMSIGKYQEALEIYNKAIELNSNDYTILSDRGLCKKKIGDFDGAIKDYTSALKINPIDILTYTNRASTKICIDDYQGALDDCEKALKLEPNNIHAYYYRGLAKRLLNDYQNAIKDFSKVLEINSNDVSAYCERGKAKLDLKDYDEAISDFTEVLKIEPNNINAYFHRIIANINKKNYTAIVDDCNIVLNLGKEKTQTEAYYCRGMAQFKLGNKVEAYNDIDYARKRCFDGRQNYGGIINVDKLDEETAQNLHALFFLVVIRQLVGLIAGMAYVGTSVMQNGHEIFRDLLLENSRFYVSEYKNLKELLDKEPLLKKSTLLKRLQIPELDSMFRYELGQKIDFVLYDRIFEDIDNIYLHVVCSIWLGVFDKAKNIDKKSEKDAIYDADEAIKLTQFMSGDIFRPTNPTPMMYETGLSQIAGLLLLGNQTSTERIQTDRLIILHLIHFIVLEYGSYTNEYLREYNFDINFYTLCELNPKIQRAIFKAIKQGQITTIYHESISVIAKSLMYARRSDYANCILNLLIGVDSMMACCNRELGFLIPEIRESITRTTGDSVVDVISVGYKGFKHLQKRLGKIFSKLSKKFREIDDEIENNRN